MLIDALHSIEELDRLCNHNLYSLPYHTAASLRNIETGTKDVSFPIVFITASSRKVMTMYC